MAEQDKDMSKQDKPIAETCAERQDEVERVKDSLLDIYDNPGASPERVTEAIRKLKDAQVAIGAIPIAYDSSGKDKNHITCGTCKRKPCSVLLSAACHPPDWCHWQHRSSESGDPQGTPIPMSMDEIKDLAGRRGLVQLEPPPASPVMVLPPKEYIHPDDDGKTTSVDDIRLIQLSPPPAPKPEKVDDGLGKVYLCDGCNQRFCLDKLDTPSVGVYLCKDCLESSGPAPSDLLDEAKGLGEYMRKSDDPMDIDGFKAENARLYEWYNKAMKANRGLADDIRTLNTRLGKAGNTITNLHATIKALNHSLKIASDEYEKAIIECDEAKREAAEKQPESGEKTKSFCSACGGSGFILNSPNPSHGSKPCLTCKGVGAI